MVIMLWLLIKQKTQLVNRENAPHIYIDDILLWHRLKNIE